MSVPVKRMSLSAQKALDFYLKESQNLNKTCEHSSVKSLREAAQARLTQLGWPSRRDEDWQYTPITRFLQHEFTATGATPLTEAQIKPYLPSFEVSRMVFVDGYFDESLSDDFSGLQRGVVIETTEDRFEMSDNEDLVSAFNLEQSDAFEALNVAMVQTGLQIEIAPNRLIEKPLFILHLQTQSEHASYLRNRIQLDANAALTLIQSQVSLTQSPVHSNWVTDIQLQEGAVLKQIILQDENTQSFAFSHQTIMQASKSQLETLYVGLGGQVARHQNKVEIKGEWTQTLQNSIVFAQNEQVIDSRTALLHNLPNGTSRQLHKFVLQDKARGVFDGQINVARHAQKIDAQMDNKNLLLSDTAKMDTKPKLEIYADDVKCSHGSASGQMDPDELFYMQARGIRKAAAQQMMTEAFLLEPLDMIENLAIKQWLVSTLQTHLKSCLK